jgi:hypothetical protein
MRCAVPEWLAGWIRFVIRTGTWCAALGVSGCNAIAGIEPPTDKPADAAPLDDADAPAKSDAAPEGDAAADRAAPSCAESSQSFVDPNTGLTWTPVWYCGNRGGATLFETASHATPIGRMNTPTSWFVCYRRGEPHQGGNDVWYYTQGDESLPGWESRKAWGYMPAADVYTSVDPFAGIVECTRNP